MRFVGRILQVIVVTALVAAAVLWFASRRGDRGFIEEEVDIARPPAVVFRWISSEDLVRRWLSDVVEFKRADASAKVPDFQLVELIKGHRTTMAVKIIHVVPNQELGLQISSGDLSQAGFLGEAEFKLIGTGDYTRLTFSSHTRFISTSDRIWEPIWTYSAKYKMRDDLAKLKLLLEAEPAGSANLRASSLSR
jgi:uncharacterized protein YndB with AHSA1/START domain